MTTAGTQMSRKEKTAEMPETAETLMEMCTVRLGTTMFGVPITHILEIVGAARPQPVPLAPVFVGGLVHYRGVASKRRPPGAAGSGVRERMLWVAGGRGGRGADRLVSRL